MKVLLSWIREFVDIDESAEAIGRRLSLRGLALEGLEACTLASPPASGGDGRFEDALPYYTRAHRLDPQFDLSLHFLGRTLLNLGRFDEAEIAFKRRLALAPRSDMTRFYLACLYGRTGRHEEARRYWHEVFEVNPNFSIDHFKRAMPYKDPGVLGRLVDGLREAGISL